MIDLLAFLDNDSQGGFGSCFWAPWQNLRALRHSSSLPSTLRNRVYRREARGRDVVQLLDRQVKREAKQVLPDRQPL